MSVAAGLLMGWFYAFVAASMATITTVDGVVSLGPAGKLTPYTALVLFSTGLLVSNFLWNSTMMVKPLSGTAVPFGVGNDMFGNNAIAGFTKDAINVDFVFEDAKARSGVALIFVGKKSGENSIAVASVPMRCCRFLFYPTRLVHHSLGTIYVRICQPREHLDERF